jgi:hypothetical protein
VEDTRLETGIQGKSRMYIVSLSVQTVLDKATLLERRSLIEIMSLRCLLEAQRCVRSSLNPSKATTPLH